MWNKDFFTFEHFKSMLIFLNFPPSWFFVPMVELSYFRTAFCHSSPMFQWIGGGIFENETLLRRTVGYVATFCKLEGRTFEFEVCSANKKNGDWGWESANRGSRWRHDFWQDFAKGDPLQIHLRRWSSKLSTWKKESRYFAVIFNLIFHFRNQIFLTSKFRNKMQPFLQVYQKTQCCFNVIQQLMMT